MKICGVNDRRGEGLIPLSLAAGSKVSAHSGLGPTCAATGGAVLSSFLGPPPWGWRRTRAGDAARTVLAQ
jgi:hypothetical protein